jgi:hypothetical protein
LPPAGCIGHTYLNPAAAMDGKDRGYQG